MANSSHPGFGQSDWLITGKGSFPVKFDLKNEQKKAEIDRNSEKRYW